MIAPDFRSKSGKACNRNDDDDKEEEEIKSLKAEKLKR
jgi:hypothetical protein